MFYIASQIRFLLGFCCFVTAVLAISATESPAADTNLICHTSNPSGCYPRVFQPTENFQIIHDDQDLPPGLHIRMNIYTGLKEARLNIPMEGEVEMPDFPTEQAVVVVPQAESEDLLEEIPDIPALRDQFPQKPPPYDAAGKIQPPRENGDSVGDSEDFRHSVEHIVSLPVQEVQRIVDSEKNVKGSTISALQSLFDLSHDIYYGVELMKRSDVVRVLVTIMIGSGSNAEDSSMHRRYAASIIANSVQNNPTALKEATGSWEQLMEPICKKDCEARTFSAQIYQSLASEYDPMALKAKIHALSGLLRDSVLRDELMEMNVLNLLQSTFLKEGKKWDIVRGRIARVISDTFLDEDLGAQLGVWPTQPAASSQTCSSPEHQIQDGCWEYHVEKLQRTETDEMQNIVWAEFLKLLKTRRKESRVDAKREPAREL